MFIETIGLEQYRRVEIGDKIKSQGYIFEVAEISFQADYGSDGGIYIEFSDTNGNPHYWKEGHDGGCVISKKEVKNE